MDPYGIIWIHIKNYQNIVYIQWKYDVTVYILPATRWIPMGPRWSAYLGRQAAASPLSHRWHVDLHHPGSHRLPGSGKISQWEQDHSWSYPRLGIAGRPDPKKTSDFRHLTTLWSVRSFLKFLALAGTQLLILIILVEFLVLNNPKVGSSWNLLPTAEAK